jgi:hypothetical protein
MALNVSGLIYPSSPRLNITNYNQFLFFASQDDSSDRSAVSIEKVSQDSSENDSKEDLKCSQH